MTVWGKLFHGLGQMEKVILDPLRSTLVLHLPLRSYLIWTRWTNTVEYTLRKEVQRLGANLKDRVRADIYAGFGTYRKMDYRPFLRTPA